MADPFLGEIRPFGFNFAPQGWALCTGNLLAIAQNTALFSLLGTNFGGNGQTTFGLPDLQGRVAMSSGQGPGLTNHLLGELAGVETVTLSNAQLPSHRHTLGVSETPGTTTSPEGQVPAIGPRAPYATPSNASFADGSVRPTGGSQPHNNMMPYLAINYCIALQGIYPPRN